MFTTDPEIMKIVLATEFSGYEKGDRFKDSARSVLGEGVFNSDGDMWKYGTVYYICVTSLKILPDSIDP